MLQCMTIRKISMLLICDCKDILSFINLNFCLSEEGYKPFNLFFSKIDLIFD